MELVHYLHGVLNSQLVTRVFADFEGLFALPEEVKHRCLRKGLGSGYTPYGIEGVRDLPKDIHRCFWDVVPGQHCFPPAFDARYVLELYDVVRCILQDLFIEKYPQHRHDVLGGIHHLRATHFLASTSQEIVMPDHVDTGLFTGFIGGSRRGLEGKRGEEWREVDNPVGDLLIGAGTLLRLYDPTTVPFVHRVRGFGESRVSLAFFFEPWDEVILPNGELARDRARRLEARFRAPT